MEVQGAPHTRASYRLFADVSDVLDGSLSMLLSKCLHLWQKSCNTGKKTVR
jgi:hypothetical protein